MSRHRYWFWLVPVAFVTSAAAVVLVSRGGAARPRPEAALPSSAALAPDLASRHARPDLADYNVLIGMRDGLAREARSLAGAIRACQRRASTPSGAGVGTPAACVSPPLRVAMMTARFGPVMMAGVFEHLGPGRCMALASGLATGFSELGDGSFAWIADIQNPGPTSGARNRADAREMGQVAGEILRLAANPSWRTACRPRPYDPSEHPGTLPAPRPRRHGPRVSLTA